MNLIHGHLHHWNHELTRVPLRVERGILAKRRWRGIAEDGSEFGFDLEHALEEGDAFFTSDSAVYVLEQLPEPVLEIALGAQPSVAARLGWLIGNLHFQIGIDGEIIRAVDDPAIRALLDREHILFIAQQRVFRPLGGGHSHDH